MNKHPLWLSLLGATALLAACGGGGYDAPPPEPTAEIPSSASASAADRKNYVVALSQASANDKEPLSLAGFNPVQPENTEPEVLN